MKKSIYIYIYFFFFFLVFFLFLIEKKFLRALHFLENYLSVFIFFIRTDNSFHRLLFISSFLFSILFITINGKIITVKILLSCKCVLFKIKLNSKNFCIEGSGLTIKCFEDREVRNQRWMRHDCADRRNRDEEISATSLPEIGMQDYSRGKGARGIYHPS